jgi:hypothetical protein
MQDYAKLFMDGDIKRECMSIWLLLRKKRIFIDQTFLKKSSRISKENMINYMVQNLKSKKDTLAKLRYKNKSSKNQNGTFSSIFLTSVS